jgi:hypothetical protein
MRVEPIGSEPYVYNTNRVSSASLNKVNPISNDLNERKTDFTEINKREENTNPLRPGQTKNFQEVVDKQMAESERNAARIFPKEEEAAPAPATTVAEDSAEVEDFALPAAQEEEAEAVTPPSQEEEVEEVTPPSQAEEAEEVVPPSQAEDAEETAQAAENPDRKTVFSETTVFANIVPDGLGFPKPNDVVDALTAKAEEEKAKPEPAEDTASLYQRQRASDAYEMTMGLEKAAS